MPSDVHHGRAQAILQQRQVTLDAAYAAHPERFVRGNPKVRQLPTASYINRPMEANSTPSSLLTQSHDREDTPVLAAQIDELGASA